jgi:uncharacterized protein involved in exopolysaccharide biosynthesis
MDPYPDSPELSARDKARLIIQDTQTPRVDPITMEPLVESNAFAVIYQNPDREKAQEVTTRLIQMFLDYSRASRTESATATHDFLSIRSEQALERIEEVEAELAQFRGRYRDSLPETITRNEQSLDRVQRDLDTLQVQILLAEQRKRNFELQLSQINPNLFDPEGDWRTELAATRAELAAARQRYTEEHPTVRRLRQIIEGMSARAEAEGDIVVAPNNPDYILVQSQLDTVNQELTELRSRAGLARAQIEEYEQSRQITPEVEQEYSRLTRELALARDAFGRFEEDRRQAELAQELESEERGLRYLLLRPADSPTTPASPNRRGILLLGIVLGGGLAVGLAALRESSDGTVRSPRDLAEVTDIKPLGSIPVILNAHDKRVRLLAWTTSLIVAAILISFVGTAVASG